MHSISEFDTTGLRASQIRSCDPSPSPESLLLQIQCLSAQFDMMKLDLSQGLRELAVKINNSGKLL